MADPNSQELLDQYVDGRGDAATAIFDRYVQRLIALARGRIGGKLKRRLDPEDVVQSAYRSFFAHAKNQEYQLVNSGDLWRLLASVTINKLHGQIEKHTAAKRSIERETPEALKGLKARDPTIADVVAVGEQVRLIIRDLSPDEGAVLLATLQGKSTQDISNSIGKSERTVRRLLAQAKERFEERLLGRQAQVQTARSPLVEPRTPLKFSDYLLQQLLGSGGMGKVYRATDKRTGKTVAVKALHKARQSDERAVAQLVRESQILARLRHPSIVGVQGLGRFPAGGHFIVMDFIDGADLQTRLDAGPLPATEVLSIMRSVGRAVQHAHEQGIVHCDLKPGNILVDKTGQVFVTDFGFAHIVADASRTAAHCFGGTAGYIAPEVLNLRSPPTPAADIFAMGALLWTLATGKLPTEGESLDAEGDALKPLQFVCRRCLASDPRRRYPSVADLVEALEEVR